MRIPKKTVNPLDVKTKSVTKGTQKNVGMETNAEESPHASSNMTLQPLHAPPFSLLSYKILKVDIESLKKENTEKQTKLSMLADEIEEFKKNDVGKD